MDSIEIMQTLPGSYHFIDVNVRIAAVAIRVVIEINGKLCPISSTALSLSVVGVVQHMLLMFLWWGVVGVNGVMINISISKAK